MNNKEAEIIIMVGLPGVGKSTYTEKHYPDYTMISSDKYIEEYAQSVGKSYDSVFEEYSKTAEKMFKDEIKVSLSKGLNIVVDRTNMTIKSRAKILANVPNDYKKTAITFEVNNKDEHKRRLDSRPNKVIPPFVLEMFKNIYVKPTKDEGFDEIITITI